MPEESAEQKRYLSSNVFAPWGFPGGASGKEPTCQHRRTQEIQAWSLGWGDPLEEGKATLFHIFAWRVPWTEEPGELQSIGSQRVGHDWKRLSGSMHACACTHTHTHTHTHTQAPWDQGPCLFCLPFYPLCLGQCLDIIKTQEEFIELMYLVNFFDEGSRSLKGLNNFTTRPLPGGRRTSMRVCVCGWLVPLHQLSQPACCLSGNTVSLPLIKLKLSQHCMQMSSSSVSISMCIWKLQLGCT